jgi:hypothetical protein
LSHQGSARIIAPQPLTTGRFDKKRIEFRRFALVVLLRNAPERAAALPRHHLHEDFR